MKRGPIGLLLLLGVFGCQPVASRPGATFYVQLVQGGDTDRPPAKGLQPVGPELEARLHRVFRWKHYWEVECHAVRVPPGQKVRECLTPAPTVEIELLDAEEMAIRLYAGHHLVRCRRQPVTDAFYVAGGNWGPNQSCFVVVRQDPPLPAGTD